MLAPFVVDEIRRLLAEDKLSQRQIARRLGVARGTVHRIANGKRPDYPPIEADEPPPGPRGRCPQCRAMVYLPCRACRVRRRRLIRRAVLEPCQPLGLALRPEHERRYQEVRQRREAGSVQPATPDKVSHER